VAALVYQRRKHLINVFVWPETGELPARSQTVTARQGYNLVQWTQAGLKYWAVSDLNARELSEFVQMIRSSP
jgi:anti-sigma factor RsiW